MAWPARPAARRSRGALSRLSRQTIFKSTTRSLIERLRLDKMRRLCGWGGAGRCRRRPSDVPSPSSRPRYAHCWIVAHHGDHLVGHVDSTAIEARERPARRPRAPLSPSASAAGRAKERKTPPPSAAWNASPARAGGDDGRAPWCRYRISVVNVDVLMCVHIVRMQIGRDRLICHVSAIRADRCERAIIIRFWSTGAGAADQTTSVVPLSRS